MAAPAAAPAGMTGARIPYAGIATRALALAVDAAIVNMILFAAGAVLALVGSLVADLQLDALAQTLAGCAWAAAVAAYFVAFWSTVGQTPGMRIMDVRVAVAGGGLPSVGRSLVRVVGLALAIIPLFAGFLPVLVDDRRRGLHDFLAGTVVMGEAHTLALTGAHSIEPAAAMPDDRERSRSSADRTTREEHV